MRLMNTMQLMALCALMIIPASAAVGAKGPAGKPAFKRVSITSGYLIMRDSPSVKAGVSGVFYVGDDCVPATGESKKAGGRTWVKVFNPWLRSSGWVDSKYLAASTSDCAFEKFLLGTRGAADWVFKHMDFPFVISSPNVV